MTIARIADPQVWLSGTPLSPSWLQNAQDNSNGLLGSTVSGDHFHEDFLTPLTAPIIGTNGVIGDRPMFADLTSFGSTSSWINVDTTTAPDVNTFGFMTFKRDPGAGGSGNSNLFLSGPQHYIGTADFSFAARVRIKAVGNVLPVAPATGGLRVGARDSLNLSFPGFTCIGGGSQVQWYLSHPATTIEPSTRGFVPTGITITDNKWYVLEGTRIGGVITCRINGQVVYTSLDSTSWAQWNPKIDCYSASISAGTEILAVDYIALSTSRPTNA